MAEKIGVYVCECGPNIADNIEIDRVIKEISPMEGVAVVKRFGLLCSGNGKEFLKKEIEENELTHLVVAACSPRQHEVTFMNVCKEGGINPYLFQLANIREQCAWVIEDKEEATDKAIRHVKAAIRRVRYHAPLEKREIESNPDVLVIGGGISGLSASLLLAGPERKIYLVEKEASLGGKLRNYESIYPTMEPADDLLDQKIKEVEENENIEIFTGAEVEEALGFFGNFEIKARVGEETKEFNVGAVVTTTGFDLYDAAKQPQLGLGKYDDVYTSMQFEQMNLSGNIKKKDGKTPKSVALIHCVGREEKGYCSKVCCLYSLKFARYLMDKLSGVKVSHFYSDMCLPGKTYQRFYEETKDKGADFIRASDIKVEKGGKNLAVKYKNAGGKAEAYDADMVVLAPAIRGAQDAAKIAEMLNITVDDNGFFAEEHEKLNPVSTPIEGVYVAGCAHGPKNISESIDQSQAATGRILSSLIPGRKIEPEVKVSEITEALCTGCKTCLNVCSYSAISYDPIKNVSVVNGVICRGCGNCVGACPSDAIKLKGFTTNQLYQEMMEAVK